MTEQVTFDDGENGFEISGTQFVHGYGRKSTSNRFFIRKSRELVQRYVELSPSFRSGAMVELGIAAGGSTALLALLAEPRKLVALEINEQPVPALAEFIEAHGLSDVVRPYYGVDQADRERLAEIMDAEFSGQPVDLVIDDASHLLPESRSSFESLFPLLRPGGLFVIEDWNGKHLQADSMRAMLADSSRSDHRTNVRRITEQIVEKGFPPKPLSRLVVELMLARASSGEAIEEITIGSDWTVIRRGPAALDHASFRVADLYEDHFGLVSD